MATLDNFVTGEYVATPMTKEEMEWLETCTCNFRNGYFCKKCKPLIEKEDSLKPRMICKGCKKKVIQEVETNPRCHDCTMIEFRKKHQ